METKELQEKQHNGGWYNGQRTIEENMLCSTVHSCGQPAVLDSNGNEEKSRDITA